MPFRIGLPELLILLVIVLLLFGGRISKIAAELGRSIKVFRKSISDNEKDQENKDKDSF